MKRYLLITLAAILLFGCFISGGAGNFVNTISEDVSTAINIVQRNAKNRTVQRQRGMDEGMRTLQDVINATKAQKALEIEKINNQIKERKNEIKTTYFKAKMTFGQKRARISQLKKEIKALETEKENIDEKYRQIIRDFRN